MFYDIINLQSSERIPIMFEFFKFIWSFLSTAFSGFGNILCEKVFKKKKEKRHNKTNKSLSDQEIILHAIERSNDFYQKEIFMRYFYKYKNKFSDDDIKNITQKMEENHPNYCILLNILLGLIESIN